MIGCLVFGWFFLLDDEYQQLGKHIAGGAGFISNFILWFESGYFDNAAATKPLLHLWSLGIEEQFYIIWPLLLWAAWKKRFNLFTITLVIAIISFGLNLHWYKTKPTIDFFSPQTRFWELLCGAMLAWAHLHFRESLMPFKEKLNRWIGKAIYFDANVKNSELLSHVLSISGMLLLIIGVFVTKEINFPGKWALLPVLSTVLLISAGKDGWFNRKILSNKILVWFGIISYPLYLWHWPVLTFSRIFMREEPQLWIRITALPVCIFLAWITTKFIENPLRFGIHGNVKTIGLFIVMLCVGIAGFTIYKKQGLPSRWPDAIAQLSEIQKKDHKNNRGFYNGCTTEQKIPTNFKSCAHKIRDDKKQTVLIWGDSHATHLVYGFEKQLGSKFNILQRTTASCPAIFNMGYEACKIDNNFVFNELIKNKPDKIVLAAAWHFYDYKRVGETIAKLKQNGFTDIVVIGPVPVWKNKLPTELITAYVKDGNHHFPVRLKADETKFTDIDKNLANLSKENQVSYISPSTMLCNKNGCLTRATDSLDSVFAFDSAHLTEPGSDYVVSLLKDDPFFKVKK